MHPILCLPSLPGTCAINFFTAVIIPNYSKLFQIIPNYSKLLQIITNHYKSLQIYTNYYKFIQIITNLYKSLQIITNYYKLLQIITNYYKLLQIITNYYKCSWALNKIGKSSKYNYYRHLFGTTIFVKINKNLLTFQVLKPLQKKSQQHDVLKSCYRSLINTSVEKKNNI
jgi:hypothetical protein